MILNNIKIKIVCYSSMVQFLWNFAFIIINISKAPKVKTLMLNKFSKISSLSLLVFFLMPFFLGAQSGSIYLREIRDAMKIAWPNNRTINFVFHGHSVPAGYFVTPDVRKFSSYPHLSLVKIKDVYANAVVNSITTSIGGENSEQGQLRFANEVLLMRPDVLFIDYALNDRNLGLAKAKIAWQKMIDSAKVFRFTNHLGVERKVRIVLLTPTPDTQENILSETSPLALHSAQIRQLAIDNEVEIVDSYALFKKIAATESLSSYMSQNNHPNAKGHQVVADAIAKLFTEEEVLKDGTYRIQGVFTQKYMTVENSSTDSKTKINAESLNGSNNQRFVVRKGPNGYSIRPFINDKHLGILENSVANGANLAQLDSLGIANQFFSINHAKNGEYWIINKNSSKYIATPGTQNIAITPIIQWDFFNNDNYRWKFIPAETNVISDIIDSQKDMFKIFPNPVLDEVFVEIPSGGDFELKIFSTEGKLVHIQTLQSPRTKLDIKNRLEKGIYLFEFNDGKKPLLVKKIFVE